MQVLGGPGGGGGERACGCLFGWESRPSLASESRRLQVGTLSPRPTHPCAVACGAGRRLDGPAAAAADGAGAGGEDALAAPPDRWGPLPRCGSGPARTPFTPPQQLTHPTRLVFTVQRTRLPACLPAVLLPAFSACFRRRRRRRGWGRFRRARADRGRLRRRPQAVAHGAERRLCGGAVRRGVRSRAEASPPARAQTYSAFSPPMFPDASHTPTLGRRCQNRTVRLVPPGRPRRRRVCAGGGCGVAQGPRAPPRGGASLAVCCALRRLQSPRHPTD